MNAKTNYYWRFRFWIILILFGLFWTNAVQAADTGSVQIYIEPAKAVQAGAKWKPSGIGVTWFDSGDILDELEPGEFGIEFSNIEGWTPPEDIVVAIEPGKITSQTVEYLQDTGSLRVTISPEAIRNDARFKVYIGNNQWSGWKESGEIVFNLIPQSTTVQFNEVSGWKKPQNIEVFIKPNQTTEKNVAYEQITGQIKVNIEPPEAVSLGALWRIDAGQWNADSDVIEAGIGIRTIECKDLPSWKTPSSQKIEVIENNLSEVTVVYDKLEGGLMVRLIPEEANAAGAAWRIDDGEWRSSDDIVSGLPVGDHVISFKPVVGWQSPADKTITIVNGKTIETLDDYKLLKGSVEVVILPEAAAGSGAIWRIDQSDPYESKETASDLIVGSHTIYFNDILNWEKPADIDVVVESDKKTIVSAIYESLLTEPIIRIVPDSVEIEQNPDVMQGVSFDETWIPFQQDQEGNPGATHRLMPNISNDVQFEATMATFGMNLENHSENGVIFQVIHVNDYHGDLPAGYPNLPTFRRYVYVPKGKTTELSIAMNACVEYSNYHVYPVQSALMDDYPPDGDFVYNEAVYETDEWYPSENVKLGSIETIRGHTIQMLSVCPFQYNPYRKTLRAFPNIDIQINFNGEGEAVDQRLYSPEFDRFIQNIVANPEAKPEIPLQYRKAGEPNELFWIITAPEFLSAAQSLRDWKIRKGIDAIVETTEETGASETMLKDAIQTAYDTWATPPTYILLLGDAEWIYPTYKIDHQIGTDLYYSTLEGDDIVPDVFLGRIPVDTLLQAQTVVDKIIAYEKTPPVSLPFYNNAAIASYFQDNDNDGYEDRPYIHTSEEIFEFLTSTGYQVHRIYQTNSDNPSYYNSGIFGNGAPIPQAIRKDNGFLWDGSAVDIQTQMNSGVFLLIHRDHGMDKNAGFDHTGWDQPSFTETDVQNLGNNNLLPVVLSINCQSGWFDGETDDNPELDAESFAEEIIRKTNGGAVAVVGAARNSASGYNDALLKGMFDAVWPEFLPNIDNPLGSTTRLGPMVHFGKLAMDQLWGDPNGIRTEQYEIFHLFGDPTLEMWTFNPYGDEDGFTIFNDGTSELIVNAFRFENGAEWLDVTPKPPLTIPEGESRRISVDIDWSRTVPGENRERIIVESNDVQNSPYTEGVYITATALFPKKVLKITSVGKGGVEVNGKSQTLPFERAFNQGETVLITAVSDPDCLFDQWDVNGDDVFEVETDLVIDEDKTVVAHFDCPTPTVTLTVQKDGNGLVKIDGVSYELPYYQSIEEGSWVELYAYPEDKFLGWTGDVETDENPYAFQIDVNLSVTAVFETLPAEGWMSEIVIESDQAEGMSMEEWVLGRGDEVVNSAKVVIGVDETASSQKGFVLPPNYAVWINLYVLDGNLYAGPYYRHIQNWGQNNYQWLLEVNPHGNVMPLEPRTAILRWDASSFSSNGFYQLKKLDINGDETVVVPDMRTVEAIEVTGKNESQYFIVEYGTNVTIDIELKSGWNLVSLPIVPENPSLNSLFPDAKAAFEFDHSYLQADELEMGKGYWIWVPSNKIYPISGENTRFYTKYLPKGWNLMGGVNGSAFPTCEDAIEVMYEFDGELYQPVGEFQKGKGYWVYVLYPCEFIIRME